MISKIYLTVFQNSRYMASDEKLVKENHGLFRSKDSDTEVFQVNHAFHEIKAPLHNNANTSSDRTILITGLWLQH